MSIREMIRRAAQFLLTWSLFTGGNGDQAAPPRKEQEQAARRPDRTPPDDRPRPTEERAVLIRRPRSVTG